MGPSHSSDLFFCLDPILPPSLGKPALYSSPAKCSLGGFSCKSGILCSSQSEIPGRRFIHKQTRLDQEEMLSGQYSSHPGLSLCSLWDLQTPPGAQIPQKGRGGPPRGPLGSSYLLHRFTIRETFLSPSQMPGQFTGFLVKVQRRNSLNIVENIMLSAFSNSCFNLSWYFLVSVLFWFFIFNLQFSVL